MYEVGKVYVLQNCTGMDACLNGTETTVIGPPESYFSAVEDYRFGWPTDSTNAYGPVMAFPGDLRPKNPPSGEQLIRTMFEPKPVMEPA